MIKNKTYLWVLAIETKIKGFWRFYQLKCINLSTSTHCKIHLTGGHIGGHSACARETIKPSHRTFDFINFYSKSKNWLKLFCSYFPYILLWVTMIIVAVTQGGRKFGVRHRIENPKYDILCIYNMFISLILAEMKTCEVL